MAGKDRKRELARQRYERQIQRRAVRQARARRRKAVLGTVVAVAVVAGGSAALAAGLNVVGDDDKKNASADKTPTPTAAPKPTTAAACAYRPDKGSKQNAKYLKNVGMPPKTPDTTSTLQETLKTNRGDIVIDLDNKRAGCTVNSMKYLAEKGFFDKTDCHRLVTENIHVLQCGDPSGTGLGGPQYRFGDENLAGSTYPTGTLAMANAGPNTNGSQFFIVYGDTPLDPKFTVFGRVSKGMDIVEKVANAGATKPKKETDPTRPKLKLTIEDVKVSKK